MKILINVGVWLLTFSGAALLMFVSKGSAEKELKEMDDVHLGVESSYVHKLQDERGRVIGFMRDPK